MLFSSPVFVLGFLPGFLAGFFLLGRHAGAQAALAFLLGGSLFFYAWRDPALLPLLVASIAANYTTGQVLLRRPSRTLLAAGVAANLLLLGWFKYAGFLSATLGGPRLDIVLPLAISFFTFQQIMFLAESFSRTRPDAGFVAYAGFVAFFPHLIAGPIVRPSEVLPQLTGPDLARPDPDAIAEGLARFLIGLAKKLVLADTFAAFADPGFNAAAQGAPLTLLEAWVAVLAFALQIYFDFSGYSDMAVGLARMLNVRFPENFDSPYQARDIADFWRRWHISLGRFLRDYVYIPLGGNRASGFRRAGNLMLTMLLGGLWHGAAWTFVLWGGLHGLFLVTHRGWVRLAGPLPSPLARALTLLAVVLAWVPFRADGWAACGAMYQGLAGLNGIAVPRLFVSWWPALGAIVTPVAVLPHLGDARTLALPEAAALLALGWCIALVPPNAARMGERARLGTVAAGFALAMQALFLAPGATPFLYFQF